MNNSPPTPILSKPDSPLTPEQEYSGHDLYEQPPSAYHPKHPQFGIEILIPPDATQEVIRTKLRQRIVLETLMDGHGVVEAGKLANVHRSTIHRWMTKDEQFKAALATWQMRGKFSARSRVLAAADEAAALVVERMRRGDMRAALALLRGAGTLDPNASLTKELNAEQGAQKQNSAIAGNAEQDAPVEARVRELLGALSPEESTRLLQALAESSQPRLPEAVERAEEPEMEKPGNEPEAPSA